NDQAILSGHTQLVQESAGDGGGGVLLFLPVYRPGMAHGTMAERRGALLGWVDASFRLRDLISGILAGNVNAVGVTLDLDIYDGT
ncbi:CHASE domain-containing protein, partial [Duganella sp. FT3S]